MPCSRGSPSAVSFRAIADCESDEKSDRQRIREITSRGRPSTVGDSTAAPRPGVVAVTRTTAWAWPGYAESGAASSGSTSFDPSTTV